MLIINLLFAIYIFSYYKGPNLFKTLPHLWKELINPQKLKEQENMALDQKWKLKVEKNF